MGSHDRSGLADYEYNVQESKTRADNLELLENFGGHQQTLSKLYARVTSHTHSRASSKETHAQTVGDNVSHRKTIET